MILLSFFTLGFTALIQSTHAQTTTALSVDQVRFGVHPGKTRLVFDLSAQSNYRVFSLPSPYRLVIDLPSFTWKAGTVNRPSDSGVAAIRHGELEPGISRIVFDMSGPIAVRSAFALPAQPGKPNRLVIDYSLTSEKGFKQQKTKIYGSLSTSTKKHSKAPALTPIPTQKKPQKKKKPLIIIDPGHGGIDPGAIGTNKVYEKHVVLALAKELKKQLESTGEYRVSLTRNTDTFIKLGNRVKIARKHNADLFISLHADSIEKSNVRGASFYTLSEKASDTQTAKLAARENRSDLIAGIDLSVEDEEVANILVDLAMRDTTNQGKFFAGKVVNAFRAKKLKILENPHRHAGFAVLKAPDIPSVLVEAGFMSNRKESAQLNTASHRKRLASALKSGINAYFEQVRKNQRL